MGFTAKEQQQRREHFVHEAQDFVLIQPQFTRESSTLETT